MTFFLSRRGPLWAHFDSVGCQRSDLNGPSSIPRGPQGYAQGARWN